MREEIFVSWFRSARLGVRSDRLHVPYDPDVETDSRLMSAARLSGLCPAGGVGALVDLAQHAPGDVEERLPGRGQANAAGGPVEELDVQLPFEPANSPRRRCRRGRSPSGARRASGEGDVAERLPADALFIAIGRPPPGQRLPGRGSSAHQATYQATYDEA